MRFHELVQQQVDLMGGQSALAKAIGASQQTISNWLRGGTPDGARLAKFIVFTGLDPDVVIASLLEDGEMAEAQAKGGEAITPVLNRLARLEGVVDQILERLQNPES